MNLPDVEQIPRIQPHIAALVLARGGSKSIPLKNIRPLCGIPLIGWVLKAAAAWNNHDGIANIAKQCKSVQVHRRSAECSRDDSSSLEAVQEFLTYHPEIDILVLLQCTSPCLHPHYLEKAFALIEANSYDSVFSVSKQHKLRWKQVESGCPTEPLNFNPNHRPRRQDWQGELVENGMFYFSKTDLIMKGQLQGGRCGYVEILPEHSIEIDIPMDWYLAEVMVERYGFQEETHSPAKEDQRINGCCTAFQLNKMEP